MRWKPRQEIATTMCRPLCGRRLVDDLDWDLSDLEGTLDAGVSFDFVPNVALEIG